MSESTLTVAGSEARLVRVLEEYLAALEAGTPPDKDAWLARHPELAEDLEACLASLDFIRRADPRAGERGGEPTVRMLGDYRIIREVGHGGMGVVYEAEQISLGRRGGVER